jgi:hypothetical protein
MWIALRPTTARMKRPFRTLFICVHETRHHVPGWYESSRWDVEFLTNKRGQR